MKIDLEALRLKLKFITCIFRLSGEVEEKNRTITKLEERVRELEGNRQFMDSVDAGFVIVLFTILFSVNLRNGNY